MADLLHSFTRTLDALLPADRARPTPLVVGVSGGADSLALLHLLVRTRDALRLAPLAVHVNHGLRGMEADADEDFVAQMADAWDVQVRVVRMDVAALVDAHSLSVEEAARQARYTALARAAVEAGSMLIAVAHNADDQAETVLMHLLRGAGLAGLRGMRPVTPLGDYHLLEPAPEGLLLLRPLLDVPRAAIEAYCAAFELEPRFDRSNLDTTYFRNRLRHDVLPLLEDVAPGVGARLAQTADVLAADYDVLAAQTGAAWEAVVRHAGEARVSFGLAAWRALPLALRRGVVRRAVWHLRASLRDVSYAHVENAVRVGQSGDTGAQATLPGGLALTVGYDVLWIAAEGTPLPAPDWPLLPEGAAITLDGLGEVSLLGSAWRFKLAEYNGPRTGPAWAALLADRWAAPLDAGALGMPVTLRTRRPGDRFQPGGLDGTQKISDFMINAKIPAAWRGRVPLLAAADGQIAWLAGWRVAERFTVGEETDRVWLARFVPPEPTQKGSL